MYCCKEARAGCSRGGRGPSRLPHEPNFDLAWQAGDTAFVVEIKSITDDNEEEQLRIGLGQVLRYRHCFQCIGYPKVIAVLVPSGPLATPPGQIYVTTSRYSCSTAAISTRPCSSRDRLAVEAQLTRVSVLSRPVGRVLSTRVP